MEKIGLNRIQLFLANNTKKTKLRRKQYGEAPGPITTTTNAITKLQRLQQ